MPAAPLPTDEDERLASLRRTGALDRPANIRLDHLARQAADAAGAPMAFVSLVDRERQWLAAKVGTTLEEAPRDTAFCAYAILSDEVLWVEDARLDARFADNPLVTGGPLIRHYAGAPILDGDGRRLGAVCVLSPEPRQRDWQMSMTLSRLAALAGEEICRREARQSATELYVSGLAMEVESLRSVVTALSRALSRTAEANFVAELDREWTDRAIRNQSYGDAFSAGSLAGLRATLIDLGFDPPVGAGH
jgi:hypothetical protein